MVVLNKAKNKVPVKAFVKYIRSPDAKKSFGRWVMMLCNKNILKNALMRRYVSRI